MSLIAVVMVSYSHPKGAETAPFNYKASYCRLRKSVSHWGDAGANFLERSWEKPRDRRHPLRSETLTPRR